MRESTPGHWDRYWREHGRVEETYSNEDRLLRQVEHLDLEGRRILEVGAGSGRDSIELGRRGAELYLVDYVMSAFDVIRSEARKAGLEVRCVCCDARMMPFRDGSFALVFHQGLLEHFRDPMPLLRENFRVTAPGGHCLVDVPQRYHPYTLVKHVLIALGKWFAGWETEFSPAHLRQLMEQAGFQVVGIGGDWMLPGFWYRSLRYALRGVGVARLPLYPRILRWWAAATAWLRKLLRSTGIGPWTFAMVNVLGRKRESAASARGDL